MDYLARLANSGAREFFVPFAQIFSRQNDLPFTRPI
jgi:hypothetical protein